VTEDDRTVLVFNAGSSSLKYLLIRGDEDLAAGVVERVGDPGGRAGDHAAAIGLVVDRLRLGQRLIAAVGHRVVHGGTRFRQPVLIDDAVLSAIEELTSLAPLHNPTNLACIRAARQALPGVTQVAVFDTAFHATLSPAAATYALDQTVTARHGIRRYGFHGISVRYVVAGTAALLGRPVAHLNMIVLHLGNGASATAVASGRSVDTSMGLTPLEGLVMGTRTGDIDPAVVFHLARVAGMALADIEDLYQHHGGLAGLCGDNDMRTVQSRAEAGDTAARQALQVYCYRIRKYIGAYHAVLGRLDAIAFTAGVGEHSPLVRSQALAGLQPMGIAVDEDRNHTGSSARVISPRESRVAVCVVPTDEEHAIAEETAELLNVSGATSGR
jgi:acetate kinase